MTTQTTKQQLHKLEEEFALLTETYLKDQDDERKELLVSFKELISSIDDSATSGEENTVVDPASVEAASQYYSKHISVLQDKYLLQLSFENFLEKLFNIQPEELDLSENIENNKSHILLKTNESLLENFTILQDKVVPENMQRIDFLQKEIIQKITQLDDLKLKNLNKIMNVSTILESSSINVEEGDLETHSSNSALVQSNSAVEDMLKELDEY